MKILNAFYVWILGLCIGGIVACGVFSAPIIFNANSILPHLDITIEDSGILMTKIFLKLEVLLLISAVAMLIYEGIRFYLDKKFLIFALSVFCAVLVFVFAFYYTPFMVEAQLAGIASSGEFVSMHKQSEWLVKILSVTLSICLFYRVIKG